MQRLAFLLSGEHETIPSSEALASIEAEGFDYKVIEKLDQMLIVETEARPADLSRRLGLTHWIGEHFCTAQEGDLIDAIGSSDLIDFLPQSKSISIRVKRVKQYLDGIKTQELAKDIGEKILSEFDYEINLDYPENEVIIVLTEDKCVVSLVRAKTNRTNFNKRKPPKRSAVHPSTMQPHMARTLVNLARAKRGDTLLDPFCGVGGIMLEAGLIGAEPIGIDIDPSLIEGAKKNLQEAGIKEFKLESKDARDIKLDEVDSIATDPPYGRQASTGGSDLRDLYEEVIPILVNLLKEEKYMCITSPSEFNLERFENKYPIELKELHEQRVHGSLSRKIYVFQRRIE